MFQSTHPRGVRHEGLRHDCPKLYVSIHAPTRGATLIFVIIMPIMLFQSTHPRGVRPSERHSKHLPQGFNPRTHEGCDVLPFVLTLMSIMFQSTHPRGVRPKSQLPVLNPNQFQSTHPRGVRLERIQKSSFNLCFNPRTHEGCDQT